MGMDVTIPQPDLPPWPRFQELAAAGGLPLQLRMIDGLPAFPDEEPPAEWQELRLGLPAGMVTLRREPEGLRVIVWGNADQALLNQRDKLVALLDESSETKQ